MRAAGPGALLSHRSAAALVGLEAVQAGDEIEVVNHSGNSLQGVRVHRLRPTDRPRAMFTRWDPVHPGRTDPIDICGWLPRRIVGRALDDTLRKELVSLRSLRKELDLVGGRGRRGTKDFRILLTTRDRFDSEMRSPFERRMRLILKHIEKGMRRYPTTRFALRRRIATSTSVIPPFSLGSSVIARASTSVTRSSRTTLRETGNWALSDTKSSTSPGKKCGSSRIQWNKRSGKPSPGANFS